MPHEIDRVLQAVCGTVWAIDQAKGEAIAQMLSLRAAGVMARVREPQGAAHDGDRTVGRGRGKVAVVTLHGTVAPRANMLSNPSDPGGASLDAFASCFRQAAADPEVGAIVLDIDSPGGAVDMVPETAEMIMSARREGRPIVAVANTMAASAAYWIATAADELSVSPSGLVGSVGVYAVMRDESERHARQGVKYHVVKAGPRKAEGNPYEPTGPEALGHMQAEANAFYAMFAGHVSRRRGVAESVVRADPEKSARHFGGGRGVLAAEAVRLGMADRVETLDQAIRRMQLTI